MNNCWSLDHLSFSSSITLDSFCSLSFYASHPSPSFLDVQERIIERLKDQREKEEKEKGDEAESSRKELKELREKVSHLQADLADREVEHTLMHICAISQKDTLSASLSGSHD